MKKIHLCALAACSMLLAACDGPQGLEEGFRDPSSTDVQTSVYWYWISGNVSKEGVVADLESMKRIGIDRAFIGNIGLPESEMPHRGPVKLFTEEWYEIMHTALKKATELGIDIGVFNCPGWSQAGGPWIKPEEAMRYLATVPAEVEGGRVVEVTLPAPSPDFTDVRTIAVPLPEGVLKLDASAARVSGSAGAAKAFDGDPATALACSPGHDAVVEVKPVDAFTLRSVRIYPAHAPFAAAAELQAVKDGRTTVLRRFDINRTNPAVEVGFDGYAPVTIACEPTEADAFRLVVSGASANGGLAEVEFSALPLVERYSEKSLAKMHQTPLPYWGDYMWGRQPPRRILPPPLRPSRSWTSAIASRATACAGRLPPDAG